MAEDLRDQLPREVRDVLGNDEAAFETTLARLIDEGAQDVLAHLHGGSRGGSEASA
jgi:hypothetical protein